MGRRRQLVEAEAARDTSTRSVVKIQDIRVGCLRSCSGGLIFANSAAELIDVDWGYRGSWWRRGQRGRNVLQPDSWENFGIHGWDVA